MQCSQILRAIIPQTIARMMTDTHNTHYKALIIGIYVLNIIKLRLTYELLILYKKAAYKTVAKK